MKSERKRSLTWRKLTKGKVFSQKGMFVGRRGGEVGEMGLCQFLQEGRNLLSVSRVCVHQIRHKQLRLVCFVLGCFD